MSDKKDDDFSGLDASQFDADPNDIQIVGEEEDPKPKKKGRAAKKEAAAEQELKKAKDDFLYLRAEFDNFRKQAIKERSDLVKYGAERVIRDLLDVLDIFDRALETEITPENIESFKQGVELTATNLKSTLEKHGVKELAGQGEAFNPSVHEAIGSQPSDDIPSGHIMGVLKKAYGLHDRVVRPGQVIVATENVPQEVSVNDSSEEQNLDDEKTQS